MTACITYHIGEKPERSEGCVITALYHTILGHSAIFGAMHCGSD